MSSFQDAPLFHVTDTEEEDSLFTDYNAKFFRNEMPQAVYASTAIRFDPKELGEETLPDFDGTAEVVVRAKEKFSVFQSMFDKKRRSKLSFGPEEDILAPKLVITEIDTSDAVWTFQVDNRDVNVVLNDWFSIIKDLVRQRTTRAGTNSVLTTSVKVEMLTDDVTECFNLVDHRNAFSFFNDDVAKFLQACRSVLLNRPLAPRCDLDTALVRLAEVVNYVVVEFLEPGVSPGLARLCLSPEVKKKLKESYGFMSVVLWKKGRPSPDFLKTGADARSLQHLLECATTAFLDIDHPAKKPTSATFSKLQAHLYNVIPIAFRQSDMDEVRLIHVVLLGALSLLPFARGSEHIYQFTYL